MSSNRGYRRQKSFGRKAIGPNFGGIANLISIKYRQLNKRFEIIAKADYLRYGCQRAIDSLRLLDFIWQKKLIKRKGFFKKAK